MASETTTPRRSWLRPRTCSGLGRRTIGRRSAGRSRLGFECLWRSERGIRLRFGLRAGCAGVAAASGSGSGSGSAAGSSPSGAGSSVGSSAAASGSGAGSSASGVSSGWASACGSSACGSSAWAWDSVSSVVSFFSSSVILGQPCVSLVSRAARSVTTVRLRAISRFASLRLAVFSSAPVAPWKRRLKSSWRVSAKRFSSSSSVMSRSSLARKEIGLPLHDSGLERQLPAREPERLLRQALVDPGQLEHHAAGLDDGDPVLGCPLTGAHARLGRLLGHRLVREDVDPDLSATADLARHRDSGGLDLTVRDPAGLERFQAVVAGLHLRLTLGEAAAAAALVLAELGLLREQHQVVFFLVRGFGFGFGFFSASAAALFSVGASSFVGSSTGFLGVVVSGASATAAAPACVAAS